MLHILPDWWLVGVSFLTLFVFFLCETLIQVFNLAVNRTRFFSCQFWRFTPCYIIFKLFFTIISRVSLLTDKPLEAKWTHLHKKYIGLYHLMNVSPFRNLSTEKVSFGFNIISLKLQGKCLRKTLIYPSFRYSTFIDFPQVVKLF